MSIGISYDDFWHMNPHIINIIAQGHNKRLQMIDSMVWQWFGTYGLSAVSTAIEHNFGKGKSKYVDKTVLQMIEDEEYRKKQDRKEYKGMTKEQKQEAEWDMAKSYFDSLAARFPKEKDKTD